MASLKTYLICIFALSASLVALARDLAAEVISFRDASEFGNFQIYRIYDSGALTELDIVDGRYVFGMDNIAQDELVNLAIRFKVPSKEQSAFTVRKARALQINLDIVLTEALTSGIEIPVYYFGCIGKCGFDEIDPISNNNSDRVFERFFKAAQMSEHYFLRLGSRDSPEARRAFRLWRDASYYLGEHTFGWWRITRDIGIISADVFDDDTAEHRATQKYMSDVNNVVP